MTLRTIQPIGKKPVTAPNIVARNDMSAGMVKTTIDEIGDNQGNKRRDVSLHLVGRNQYKQRDDRQRRRASRQELTVQWIVDLIPHWSLPRAAERGCHILLFRFRCRKNGASN